MMKTIIKVFLFFLCAPVFTLSQGTYSITDVTWKNQKDVDSDGYTQSRTMRIEVSASEATFGIFRIFYFTSTTNPTIYYTETEGRLIPQGDSYLELAGFGTPSLGIELPHNKYNFVVQIRAWPSTTTILADRGYGTDNDLKNETFETANEDKLVKPNITSFVINNDAIISQSRGVSLDNVCENNPTHYMASELVDFSDATWQQYSSSPSFTLSKSNGNKTVYFKVKNSIGESDLYAYDNIELWIPEYSITGIKINNGFISPLTSSSISSLSVNDVFQFVGTSRSNVRFDIFVEDPVISQSRIYSISTDADGNFLYPSSYGEALGVYYMQSNINYLFWFGNNYRYLLTAKNYESLIKFPVLSTSISLIDLGEKVPLDEITPDQDILEYIRYFQNANSGQTISQFDLAAVKRGHDKLNIYTYDDYLHHLKDGNEFIVYVYEGAQCVGGTILTEGTASPFVCAPLVLHIISYYANDRIDKLRDEGKLSLSDAELWKGFSTVTYGVTGFALNGDPHNAFEVFEYITGIYDGTATMISSQRETTAEGDPCLNTIWSFNGWNVNMYVGGNNTTGIKQVNDHPVSYELFQSYPNPFNPVTTIQYTLPSRSMVKLQIFNMLGQQIAKLVSCEQNAGFQSAVWNANVASGQYFYRLEATSLNSPNKRFIETKKMLLMK